MRVSRQMLTTMTTHLVVVSMGLLFADAMTSSKVHVEVAPSYARILGVTIGIDTTTKLEKHVGPGVEQLGGHSNSGRYWNTNKASFYSDAFDRIGNEQILDTIAIYEWKGKLKDAEPFNKFGAGVLGGLKRRMSVHETLQQLFNLKLDRKGSILFRQDVRTIKVRKADAAKYSFSLEIFFKNDRLDWIRISGSQDEP